MSSADWCADYKEPSSFLNIMLSSSNNTAHHKSAEFDRLMAGALTAKTEQQRAELYQKDETHLDKDSTIVPVHHNVSARLVKPYVGGSAKDPLAKRVR